jgi:hypothetical protein
MKLRLKDNSIRFRLLRGEVEVLAETGRIEAHTILSLTEDKERIAYSIEHDDRYRSIGVTCVGCDIRVTVPSREILAWANGEAIGLYGEQPIHGNQKLIIMIEKDLACADRSDADNSDTFANPKALAC